MGLHRPTEKTDKEEYQYVLIGCILMLSYRNVKELGNRLGRNLKEIRQ